MKSFLTFRGKVKKNKGRGKLLGFPTANVTLHKKISEGIYASQVTIDGQNYQAATFIGSAKTFGEKDYKAESYILDFNKNIYGKWITVRLFKKLRRNIEFDSAQTLIKQMEQDVSAVRKFFKARPSAGF